VETAFILSNLFQTFCFLTSCCFIETVIQTHTDLVISTKLKEDRDKHR